MSDENLYSNEDMRKFIQYVNMFDRTGYSLFESTQEQPQENEETEQEEQEDEGNQLFENLLEDLSNIKTQLLNHTETECDDENYAMGSEQGMYKAAELLEQVINNKYDRNI